MGLTHVSVVLYNPKKGPKGRAYKLLVDSGSVYSVVPAAILKKLGVKATRGEVFTLANGDELEQEVGEVGVKFRGRAATSPVVFGDSSDVFLLGAVTLETLGFVLDPIHRELRAVRLMLATSIGRRRVSPHYS